MKIGTIVKVTIGVGPCLASQKMVADLHTFFEEFVFVIKVLNNQVVSVQLCLQIFPESGSSFQRCRLADLVPTEINSHRTVRQLWLNDWRVTLNHVEPRSVVAKPCLCAAIRTSYLYCLRVLFCLNASQTSIQPGNFQMDTQNAHNFTICRKSCLFPNHTFLINL